MFFFFFSSRRRHTRLTCDWSSDVCSSDLAGVGVSPAIDLTRPRASSSTDSDTGRARRSEERRVGKECRSRWSPHDEKKNRGSHLELAEACFVEHAAAHQRLQKVKL